MVLKGAVDRSEAFYGAKKDRGEVGGEVVHASYRDVRDNGVILEEAKSCECDAYSE